MPAFRKLIATTSVIIAFSTPHAGNATSQNKPYRGQVLAMDDMKPMQPASPGQAGGMNMKQGSPKMGPGGMMMDGGMKSSPMQGQEKCQGGHVRAVPRRDDADDADDGKNDGQPYEHAWHGRHQRNG
jgi:hypothetical protein